VSSELLAPSPPSECVLPPHQRRGVHTRRAVRGWGVNISEDARHRIGLLQYTVLRQLVVSWGGGGGGGGRGWEEEGTVVT
jgi:hypothetical protein